MIIDFLQMNHPGNWLPVRPRLLYIYVPFVSSGRTHPTAFVIHIPFHLCHPGGPVRPRLLYIYVPFVSSGRTHPTGLLCWTVFPMCHPGGPIRPDYSVELCSQMCHPGGPDRPDHSGWAMFSLVSSGRGRPTGSLGLSDVLTCVIRAGPSDRITRVERCSHLCHPGGPVHSHHYQ
jgi:hypothetical protein